MVVKGNQPTSGPRFEKELPSGTHPLQLYSLGTPNGQKVTILLEELGLAYDAWKVDIMQGENFGSGFLRVNPNEKVSPPRQQHALPRPRVHTH
jgi:GSH-dependent disulfide-bond oxidoreductase